MLYFTYWAAMSLSFSDRNVCYHRRYKEVLNGFYKKYIMLIFGLKFHLFYQVLVLWGRMFSEDRDLTTNSLVLATTNSELHDSKTCKSDSENDATTENKHVLENDKNARYDQKETYSEEGEEVRRWNEVVMEWRKQHVSLDVWGRYVRYSVAKVVFAVWGEKRWCHREFIVLVVSGRSVNVSKKCCPEVKQLGVGVEFCIAVNIANFGGDLKLFLCVAYWMHLIHIQWGTFGLREIDARGP